MRYYGANARLALAPLCPTSCSISAPSSAASEVSTAPLRHDASASRSTSTSGRTGKRRNEPATRCPNRSRRCLRPATPWRRKPRGWAPGTLRQDRATSPVTVIPTTAGEAWLIHYADVEVEQIEKIEVLPHVGVTWHWRCGFYPGCEPGEIRGGDAATFEEARAAFEAAWRIFRAGCTEADFQAWREDRDWHARKYAMWDRGKSCLGSCRIR
jgi:hypothetical protein